MGSALKPGEVFAGYEILQKLGAGGMGAVYKARDRDLPRFVALKLLSMPGGDGDREHRVRFRREADAIARLQHPNIVTVYARGEDDGRLWISMTFVDGSDVAQALRRGPMHPARAVSILAETAAALDHAHDTGILHRDVKPANILLSQGRQERALLTDFGIAKSLDESRQLTQRGEILASFQYAAPERLTRPGEADRRADVYSLGCTLFHMLTGEPPYPGQNVGEIIYGHAYKPVPVPSHYNPTLPRAFDDIVAQAMAKEPERRFDTCTRLAATAAQLLRQPQPPRPEAAAPNPEFRYSAVRSGPTRIDQNVATLTGRPPSTPPTGTRLVPPVGVTTMPPAGNTAGRTGGTAFGRQGGTAPAPASGNTRPPLPPTLPVPSDPGTRPYDDTGPRDLVDRAPTSTAPAPKRGNAARVVLGSALLVALALVAIMLADRSDDSGAATPPSAVATAVPTTTSQPPVTTSDPPPSSRSEPPPVVTSQAVQPAKTATVPDVIGAQYTQAKAELDKLGFYAQQLWREDKRAKGTVLETDPAAGKELAVGVTIKVYVSSGPATTFTMPNLVGMSVAEANGALQKLGWIATLQPTKVTVTDASKVGKIITQSPASGGSVAVDGSVTVSVGELAPSTTPTTTRGPSTVPPTTTTPPPTTTVPLTTAAQRISITTAPGY
ncbi:protein kinase domain-containing protein [Nocardia seriolae]|nr:protein kinase [Nocardia seriolae]APA98022.1 Non-specific serine/threonine protein kinase [Nocardia seriolae]MTJ62722.1 protein kinase [Nocardia seriolae]MTJ74432.1 protein kinase [Nocardia seriolae]MTJ87758.1 protein kinase [Nocardia seriolae]MTK31751.1 protein kinase [Nocardia seriolae]